MTDSVAPLSVEDLLARSKEAADRKAAGQSAGQSAVQKLLAGREEPADTVELSAVARLLKEREASDPAKTEPYTEQDWYLRAKVAQLRGQLDFYSKLGSGISDSAMNSIEDEIKGLLKKQADKIKASTAEADAKKKELDEKTAAEALEKSIPSADQLLKRSQSRINGEDVPDFEQTLTVDKAKQAAVDALLKKAQETAAKGSSVSTSA